MTAAAYRKAIAMVVFTVIGALLAKLTDGHITNGEWIYVAIAGVTSAQVFTGPNVPGAIYTKSILAGLGTILAFLVGAISDGISGAEWVQIGSIAAGSVFVFLVPNEPLPGGLTPASPYTPTNTPPPAA